MKVAPDGEILVRGENVTQGYFNADEETARAFEDGWFHTGDIGEIGAERPAVHPRPQEGDDRHAGGAERLSRRTWSACSTRCPACAIRPSSACSASGGGEERVHAVLVLEPGTDPDAVVRDGQRAAGGPPEDPSRARVARARAAAHRGDAQAEARGDPRLGAAAAARRGTCRPGSDALCRAGRAVRRAATSVSPAATIEELGLSSLERVELMVALEDAFGTRIDEGAFAEARSVSDLKALVDTRRRGRRRRAGRAGRVPELEPLAGRRAPSGASACRPGFCRSAACSPGSRWRGASTCETIDRPVIFAANHQSHMDVPVILTALPPRLRYRVAPAMAKEFFKAHFFPEQYGRQRVVHQQPELLPGALFFNAFPLPQREAGARQTLRYIGEVLEGGYSVLIFPEGKRTETGDDRPVPPRHRDDCVEAGRAGRAGAPRGARQGPAPHLADGPARAGVRVGVRRADAR